MCRKSRRLSDNVHSTAGSPILTVAVKSTWAQIQVSPHAEPRLYSRPAPLTAVLDALIEESERLLIWPL